MIKEKRIQTPNNPHRRQTMAMPNLRRFGKEKPSRFVTENTRPNKPEMLCYKGIITYSNIARNGEFYTQFLTDTISRAETE